MKGFVKMPALVASALCLAGTCAPVLADEAEAPADDGLWRPPAEAAQRPERKPRTPARLITSTVDGTFELYDAGTGVFEHKDDFNASGKFFGQGRYVSGGYESDTALLIPGGYFTNLGFEEKNIPLKPNAWYRIEFMLKGIPNSIQFFYPLAETPAGENANNYRNTVNFFNKPEAFSRDEWRLVYEEFRTNEHVGRMPPVYYWYMIISTVNNELRLDNFMLYEIDGEGGEAVGGDIMENTTVDGRLFPPGPALQPVALPDVLPALVPPSDFKGNPVEIGFGAKGAFFAQRAEAAVEQVRRDIAAKLGIATPAVFMTAKLQPDGKDLGETEVAIAILGEVVWREDLLANAQSDAQRDRLAEQLTLALEQNAHRLFTLGDTGTLLNRTRERQPISAAEVQNALPLESIHAVLAALLADGIPILQFPLIVDLIAGEAQDVKDPAEIARRVKEWLMD